MAYVQKRSKAGYFGRRTEIKRSSGTWVRSTSQKTKRNAREDKKRKISYPLHSIPSEPQEKRVSVGRVIVGCLESKKVEKEAWRCAEKRFVKNLGSGHGRKKTQNSRR